MDLELTYTKIGDYYYPDIALPDTTKYTIGPFRLHVFFGCGNDYRRLDGLLQ